MVGGWGVELACRGQTKSTVLCVKIKELRDIFFLGDYSRATVNILAKNPYFFPVFMAIFLQNRSRDFAGGDR